MERGIQKWNPLYYVCRHNPPNVEAIAPADNKSDEEGQSFVAQRKWKWITTISLGIARDHYTKMR